MKWICLAGLLILAFALAAGLEPALNRWSHRTSAPTSFVDTLLGDSRKLFANHAFVLSDVYLHSGYYPTIFDQPEEKKADGHDDSDEHKHITGQDDDRAVEHDFLGKPRNWIDAFGRNFFPSKHTHLGENKGAEAQAREILPWIRLSADMDPHRVETFTVGAYWLRTMHKEDEAMRFLREGLRDNPGSFEILYELGCSYENTGHPDQACNLWELALQQWMKHEAPKESPDKLTLAEILTRLARAESRSGNREKAIAHLETLKKYSPSPAAIQKRIDEVKAGQLFEAVEPAKQKD